MSVVTFASSLTISLACTYVLVIALPRLGFVDEPNVRSSHSVPVPRGGGVAILLGVCAGLAVAQPDRWVTAATFVAILAGLLGLVDDRFDLAIRTRLLAQLLLAGLAVAPLIFYSTTGPLNVVGLAVLWIAFVNAFNFMDGINGISALVTIVISVWFVLIGPESAQILGSASIAASLGFLYFNGFGKVFLGDVGSYSLGSLIWSMSVISQDSGVPILDSFAPMSLYAVETAVAVILLVHSGGRPGQPHRFHAYQRLVDLGAPHMLVSSFTAGVLAAMLLVLRFLPQTALAVGIALLIAGFYLASPMVVGRMAGNTYSRDRKR